MGLRLPRLRYLLLLAALGTGSLALVATSGAAEDREAPRIKLTYPPRQEFSAGRVLVRVRSNEPALTIASGQLEIGSGPTKTNGREIWGLYGVERQVSRGAKVALRLRWPQRSREAAEQALGRGEKAVVKVTVDAEDAAGNRSGAIVAVIRPKR